MSSSVLASLLCLCGAVHLPAQSTIDKPEKVTVCDLLGHPGQWNHKLVQVSGFASHGFEDSGFSDPACDSRYMGLWMEYGGKVRTGTMSTVSDWSRTRPQPMVVEGIEISLVDDAMFHRFDTFLHSATPSRTVHTTVIGRFFAGRPEKVPTGEWWHGFGHMGCCSLFVIQQVLDVDDHVRPGVDYSDTPEQMTADCVHYLGEPVVPQSELLKEQRSAEDGTRAFAFTDDRRVATEVLVRYAKIDAGKLTLTRTLDSSHRVNFEGRVGGSKVRYLVVLSKPYWLSLSAADPSKVAWVVLGASETCDKGGPNTVRVLKP